MNKFMFVAIIRFILIWIEINETLIKKENTFQFDVKGIKMSIRHYVMALYS